MMLRQFTRDDLDLVIELDSDPDVMRFINNGQPVNVEEVTEILEWWLTYYDRFEGYGFWAAIDKAI